MVGKGQFDPTGFSNPVVLQSQEPPEFSIMPFILMAICIAFSSMALAFDWFTLEIVMEDVETTDGVKLVLSDSLSERETRTYIDGDVDVDVEDNNELDLEYDGTVSMKITLQVLTIFSIVAVSLTLMLYTISLLGLSNFMTHSKYMLAISFLLILSTSIVFAVFYNPYDSSAPTLEDEENWMDNCEDNLEYSEFLNIHGYLHGTCDIGGNEFEISMQYNASAGFWMIASQILLLMMSFIFMIGGKKRYQTF